MALGPKSIRGKVTLAATAATALAMLFILGITAFAMNQILTGMISNSLDERLDMAQAEVMAGNYQAAIDLAGDEMMQIIDANGNILAETPNARGVGAIVGTGEGEDDDLAEKRFERLEFERDDDDDDEDDDDNQNQARANAGAVAGATSNTQTTPQSPVQQPAAPSYQNANNDDNDDDEDDAAEEERERAEEAAKEAAERAEEAAKEAEERAEEERERQQEAARQAARQVPQAANVDSDDDNDDGDDADDDDDDDDRGGKADKRIGLFFGERLAFAAASAASSASSSASSAANSNAATSSATSSAATPAAGTSSSSASSAASTSAATSAASSVDSAPYIDASEVFGDEGPYLVKKRQVNSPDGTATLVAVTSLASAARTASLATQLLATIFLALLCLVVAFTWNMAARTLQPVEHMRRTAESINASNLSERIPVPERDKDLSRLATTFNELLERVESSFNEQRRFVSDASHELKSPVAATGIMLETLREHPEAVDTNKVIEDLTTENNRLANIVGDLLTLARSDEGRMQVDAKPVDLMDLLLEEAAGLETRKGVSVDTSGVQPVVCTADAELLSHSVRNLLENAARYASSTVKLSCAAEEGAVRIVVSDDGCGIAPEDRERVFDRFVSLEDGRSNPDSTGLGLPVARSIAERHGGSLCFTEPELGGATAVLSIPLT